MLSLSRSQLVVYAAVAVALLLIGARHIRSTHPVSQARTESSRSAKFTHATQAMVVHVAGAVRRPGVYRMEAGARVTDAVKRSGGGRAGADLDAINLAARLVDGQQVVVPRRQPVSAGRSPAAAGADPPARGPVSLGSASLEQLETLNGVGPATAQKILDYRSQHGGFGSVDDLDKVSGIGPKKLDAIRSQVQP